LVHQNLLNYINIFPTGLFAQFIHTILFKFSAIFPFSNPKKKNGLNFLKGGFVFFVNGICTVSQISPSLNSLKSLCCKYCWV